MHHASLIISFYVVTNEYDANSIRQKEREVTAQLNFFSFFLFKLKELESTVQINDFFRKTSKEVPLWLR